MERLESSFPSGGKSPQEILSAINEMKQEDARWDTGKVFGFVYAPGEQAGKLMQEICRLYFFENALVPALFPSLARMEAEVVTMASALLNGGSKAAGSITSGGTESIILAMKTARDRACKINPGMKDMEVIVPRSAHPAFIKAAHILGLKAVFLPIRPDYSADAELLPSLINERTIMIAGSAPSYPHGIIDPIEDMARCAEKMGIWFHVDACLGGFFLPFMEMLGHKVPNYDFRIKGVTSISADLHKYGYGGKGSSVVLYRDRDIRRDQFFVHCDWPGGLYGSPTLLGSRSAIPVTSAWAMLHYFGRDGYLEMTAKTMNAAEKLKYGIAGIEGMKIIGDPAMSVFSFTSDRDDIYQVGDELRSRGWRLDSIMEPAALHIIVSQQNIEHAGEFLADLERSVMAVRKLEGHKASASPVTKIAMMLARAFPNRVASLLGSMAARSDRKSKASGSQKSAVFYGIAASIEDKTDLDHLVVNYLDCIYS